MLDQILFDSHAECPTFNAGNAVTVAFSFLNEQVVSKSLKWRLCLLNLLHVYYARCAECSHKYFLLSPSLPFKILLIQGLSQIPLLLSDFSLNGI